MYIKITIGMEVYIFVIPEKGRNLTVPTTRFRRYIIPERSHPTACGIKGIHKVTTNNNPVAIIKNDNGKVKRFVSQNHGGKK